MTNTPGPGGCPIPEEWEPYTIQAGDTMFSLALHFGLSLDELASANCIMDASNITAGQILYVPKGNSPPPAIPPSGEPSAGGPYTRFDCDNPAATITQPGPGTVLRGTVAIFGTATHPDFQFYRLQISGSGTDDGDFATLQTYPAQVINSQLGTVPTGAFASGDYWIRLTVVDNTGNYLPQCTVRVRFGA